MAVLKIKSSKGNVKNVKDYLERDNRHTERTTFNIMRSDWAEDMIINKMYHDKTDGRQYEWIVQSFEREEGKANYNEKMVHQMGVELANEIAEKGFQVVVVTHNDTDNLHNHIIINTVNSKDGRKIQLSNAKNRENSSKSDFLMNDLYKLNDEICERYGLNTLTQSKENKTEREKDAGKQPTTYKTDEKYLKNSFKEDMRDKLQRIWSNKNLKTGEDFNLALKQEGLKISRMTNTGNITYEDEYGNKARAKGLGAFNRSDVGDLLERNRGLEREQRSRDQAIEVVRRDSGRGR